MHSEDVIVWRHVISHSERTSAAAGCVKSMHCTLEKPRCMKPTQAKSLSSRDLGPGPCILKNNQWHTQIQYCSMWCEHSFLLHTRWRCQTRLPASDANLFLSLPPSHHCSMGSVWPSFHSSRIYSYSYSYYSLDLYPVFSDPNWGPWGGLQPYHIQYDHIQLQK